MKKTILSLGLIMAIALSMFVGCGNDKNNSKEEVSSASKKAESGQVTAVYNKVIETIYGKEAPVFERIEDAQRIEEMFGLKADVMKEHYIAMPMMNVLVDTVIGIEAKEGQVKAVEDALNQYKAKVIAQREEFPYLADHLPKAKAAQVITIDNYVFYLSLGSVSEDVNENNMQEKMNQEVQKAVDAVKSVLIK